jgi:hypothetical protein
VATYSLGQPVRVSTEVRLLPVPPATVGELVNAGTILLRVRKSDGTPIADYTSPVNDSTGKYHVDIPAADLTMSGYYPYAWVTTGTGAGVSPPNGFDVVDPFAPTHLNFGDARARLNISATTDDEVQAFIAAATSTQEERVGPIAPRTVVEIADPYGVGLKLPTRPVLSVTSATLGGVAVSTAGWTVSESGLVNLGTTAVSWSGAGFWAPASQRYVVTYVVGRRPSPRDLVEAGLLRVMHAQATQRGGGGQIIGSASFDVTEPAGTDFLLILRAEALEQPYLLLPGVA